MAYIEIPIGNDLVRKFELDLGGGDEPPIKPSPALNIAIGLTGPPDNNRKYKIEDVANAIIQAESEESRKWNKLTSDTQERYLRKTFYNRLIGNKNKI